MQLKPADAITSCITNHPYLSVILICLISTPLHFASLDPVRSGTLWIITGSMIVFALWRIVSACKAKRFNSKEAMALSAASIVVILSATYLYSRAENKQIWHLLGGFAVVLALYWFSDRKSRSEELNVFLITGLGFALKYYYVLITSIYDRQHDVGVFGGKEWHAGYIEYILNNHSLPNVSPDEMWQSYHPPLHHTVSAMWIGFNEKILSVDHDAARESLQVLALLYSMLIIIISIKIMRYFKLKGHALYLPLIILNFHPAIIMFAGSINNDPLAAVFVMGAILTTLKWYRKQTAGNIIKIALCIGPGMMTKMSSAVVAPAVALVFLMVLVRRIKDKNDIKGIFTQYGIFGAVCIPLGMWHPVRNMLRWGLPLLYVPGLPDNALQKINMPFFDRVTDFSSYQFRNVYEQWATIEDGTISGYNEFNPLTVALKTSVFGEYLNDKAFESIKGINVYFFSFFMFWTAVIIAILAAVAVIRLLTSGKLIPGDDKAIKTGVWFLVSFIVVSMVSYYKLAGDLPFVCTMNFRYIVPLVPVSLTLEGLWIDKELLGRAGIRKKALAALYSCFIVFAFSTTVFMGAVGFI